MVLLLNSMYFKFSFPLSLIFHISFFYLSLLFTIIEQKFSNFSLAVLGPTYVHAWTVFSNFGVDRSREFFKLSFSHRCVFPAGNCCLCQPVSVRLVRLCASSSRELMPFQASKPSWL